MLTDADIQILSKPFDDKTLGVKVQSTNRDRTKAMLVAYVQHTDAYIRIEQVDPAWKSEILHEQFMGDTCYVRVRLTIKGVSRENVGEGNDPKSATSDAIKRCAMLFGVGRYLYDSETVWVPYNEQTDKYKVFTIAEYRKALKGGQAPLPSAAPTSTTAPGPKVAPKSAPIPPPQERRTREQLGAEIQKLASALGSSKPVIDKWAKDEFDKSLLQMTIQELERFVDMLQIELGRSGKIGA